MTRGDGRPRPALVLAAPWLLVFAAEYAFSGYRASAAASPPSHSSLAALPEARGA